MKMGQRLKSVLAAPVVVIIETNWKTPARTASSPFAIPSLHNSTISTSEPRVSSAA